MTNTPAKETTKKIIIVDDDLRSIRPLVEFLDSKRLDSGRSVTFDKVLLESFYDFAAFWDTDIKDKKDITINLQDKSKAKDCDDINKQYLFILDLHLSSRPINPLYRQAAAEVLADPKIRRVDNNEGLVLAKLLEQHGIVNYCILTSFSSQLSNLDKATTGIGIFDKSDPEKLHKKISAFLQGTNNDN